MLGATEGVPETLAVVLEAAEVGAAILGVEALARTAGEVDGGENSKESLTRNRELTTAGSSSPVAETWALGVVGDEITGVGMVDSKEEAMTGRPAGFEEERPADMGAGLDTTGTSGIALGRRGTGTRRSWDL